MFFDDISYFRVIALFRATSNGRFFNRPLISNDLCFLQDTCELNACLKVQTDLADLFSLENENKDTVSHHFTSDQSKVQSYEVEGPLIVCIKDRTDLADFSSLGDENQDTDPHHFTSDQSKVQSDEVEGPLIGDHETQESEGGDADLHKYLVGCKKNPGHSQFIPVETFTLKHLHKGYQDKYLYEYIKVLADLTVRVGVEMSSLQTKVLAKDYSTISIL
uniref:Uncharacterized protein n=1 Tax=Biomphalaria glabrata TaxID=6526 RepID=A0A2C9LV33_BIOGL